MLLFQSITLGQSVLLVLVLGLVCIGELEAAPSSGEVCSEWTFDGLSPLGPPKWTSICPACGGKSQSPIDIPLDRVLPPTDASMFEPLQFTMSAISQSTFFSLTNNGHTLSVDFPQNLITVTGAGLPGVYRAAFMHWHWGKSRITGSEHTMNGKQFVMEGHLVFYNSKYNSTTEALKHPNGVAAFAILYKDDFSTSNIYNTVMNNRTLTALKQPGSATLIPAFSINYLLPFKLHPFYRYQGSLTYPPCTEGIIWTIFAQPVSLTTSQLQMMRNLYFDELEKVGPTDDLQMVNNYRPTQPLNGRPVYVIDPYSYIQHQGSEEARSSKAENFLNRLHKLWESLSS